MSVAAVLEAAYTRLAHEADARDANRRMLASDPIEEAETARYRLDYSLGLIDDGNDAPVETNVIELAAWVNRVNAIMQ